MIKRSAKSSLFIILFLAVSILVVRGIRSCNPGKREIPEVAAAKEKSINSASAWRYRSLSYTKHARCRMKCRNITTAEVEEIQRSGAINYHKSNLHDKPCGTYAVEGLTGDGQKVRIVFGACSRITTVITCIDTGEDHPCACP